MTTLNSAMSRGLGRIEQAIIAIIDDDDAFEDDYYAAEDLADRIYPKPKRIQIERFKKGWRQILGDRGGLIQDHTPALRLELDRQ